MLFSIWAQAAALSTSCPLAPNILKTGAKAQCLGELKIVMIAIANSSVHQNINDRLVHGQLCLWLIESDNGCMRHELYSHRRDSL